MTIRPIPRDRAESQQMARTGSWQGQKLCDCCGENVADRQLNGDDVCTPCVRAVSRS